MDEKIFKAYDIRGVYPQQIDEDTVYRIGRAFVSFLKPKQVVIGRDMRLSSDALFKALSKGITDSGADVIEIGLSSTPMMYFTVGNYGYDAGLMITASHNPKDYNGIKMVMHDAIPIGADNGINEIKKMVIENNFIEPNKKGTIIKKDIWVDYKNHILNYAKNLRKLKVVMDTGNAIMGFVIPKIFDELPIEIIPLYFDLDGNFPNHEANPLKFETLEDLQKTVKEKKADLGVAFDGDGDRIFFTDENGNILTGDIVTALIGRDIQKDYPHSTILYDLRSSWVVKEEIEKAGGKALMTRVGHAFIKRQMREENAVFAGELSGHFYYKDNFYTESSLITALRIFSMLKNNALSDLVRPLHRYFKSPEINFRVENQKEIFQRIEKHFEGYKINHLDGLKIENKDYWINIRASNTEPLIRLNAEARTKEKLNEVISIVKALISD